MKLLTKTAVVAAVLFPGISTARPKDEAIIVTAEPVTFMQWSKAVGRKLDDTLQYPQPMFGRDRATGVVSVRFRAADGGQPIAVTVSRQSGSGDLDRAAVRAVTRIKTLGPLPLAFRPDQQFVANILFATDQDEYDRQLMLLRKEALQRNAQHMGESVPIALFNSSHARVGS